jgi:hypothetical protein
MKDASKAAHAAARASSPSADAATANAHDSAPAYAGPERRRRRVYVTRNTEYHVEDGTCVAVRDRRTREFMDGHLALERRVEGALKFFRNGSIAPNPGEPKPGESIYFARDGRDLVTSPLESVERPDKATADGYPSRRER